MSFIFLFLLLIVSQKNFQANCAPSYDVQSLTTKESSESYDDELNQQATEDVFTEHDYEKISKQELIDEIFKGKSNLAVIKKAFGSSTNKVCIPITYDVQVYCRRRRRICNDSYSILFHPICMDHEIQMIWSHYDPNKIAGKIIIFLASSKFTIFGFDWNDACNLNDDIIFNEIDINLHTERCAVNIKKIKRLLHNITTMMPILYGLHNVTLPSDDENTTTVGYASSMDFNNIGSTGLSFDFYVFFLIFLIIIGGSYTVFTTIKEAIQLRKEKKPKIYYHFWSAVGFVIAGIYYTLKNDTQFHFEYILMVALMILPTLIIVCVKKSNIFTVPLTVLIPFNPCKFIWTYLLTIVGLYCIFLLICYIIYAVPTIVLMYHLYPIRTLVRVPFIIGAIMTILGMGSLVLYQLEKLVILNLLPWSVICMKLKKRLRRSHTQESSRREEQSSTKSCCPCKSFRSNYDTVIQQIVLEKIYDILYYRGPIVEDVKLCAGHKSNAIFIFKMNFIQLIASVAGIIAFVYGTMGLVDIVFEESSNISISINNVLLALVPTVALSAGTWMGRGIIFDVKKDLKELNLLHGEVTEQEKMIRVMNDILEQLKRIAMHDVRQGGGGGGGGRGGAGGRGARGRGAGGGGIIPAHMPLLSNHQVPASFYGTST